MDGDPRTTLAGFAGALAVLGVLLWVVGIGDVVAALSMVRPAVLVAIVLVAVAWLSAWGMSLRAVLGALGAPIPAPTAVLVFTAAVFSNHVTPFGQAGGEPVSALLISRAAESEYETGLAAIASVDALHFVPSIGFALLGLGYLGTSVTLGRNLRLAAAVFLLLALAIPALVYVGWRFRYEVEAAAVRAFTPVVGLVARVVPGRSAPDAAAIERRIEGFFRAIDRVAASPRTLLVAMGFSALGWLALSTSLWLSLFALGYTASFAVVLVVIPVGSIAGMTPLPGGLGSIEAAFVGLLASFGVAPAVASAAVLVHRAATYWLPILVGGGTAAALGADR